MRSENVRVSTDEGIPGAHNFFSFADRGPRIAQLDRAIISPLSFGTQSVADMSGEAHKPQSQKHIMLRRVRAPAHEEALIPDYRKETTGRTKEPRLHEAMRLLINASRHERNQPFSAA